MAGVGASLPALEVSAQGEMNCYRLGTERYGSGGEMGGVLTSLSCPSHLINEGGSLGQCLPYFSIAVAKNHNQGDL